MPLRVAQTTQEALRKLSTSARPNVDARDVVVPDGYEVQPVLVGFSFPTCMGFAENGTLYRRNGHPTDAETGDQSRFAPNAAGPGLSGSPAECS